MKLFAHDILSVLPAGVESIPACTDHPHHNLDLAATTATATNFPTTDTNPVQNLPRSNSTLVQDA
jgi:hypothetical protein